jgi:phosphate transport system substrate-binding protein
MKIIRILAALIAVSAVFAAGADAKITQIKGSDTLINLVQKLSEAYMEKNPGKMIGVTGGGSGTGIAALINGKCDIANSSRLIKQKEIEMAVDKGITPTKIIVAVDGLSFIVNAENKIDKLTVDELGKIFRGEVTNWKDVGGEDAPISLYGRQSNSGTYDFVMEFVTKGDYSPKMRQMNGNAQIMEAVKSDKTAIGYVGVSYAKGAAGVTVLSVAMTQGGYYASPLKEEEIRSGKYPISRGLYQYVNGIPSGDVKDFLAFELGPEGQKIVQEEGFFSLPEEYVKSNKEKAGI